MKYTLLGLFLPVFFGIAQAQTPTKIKVFTPEAQSKSSDNSYKWSVKTDVVSILTGEFPIIGEIRIAKKLSLEASAGLTYAYLPNGFLSDDESDDLFDTEAAMGTSFRGTLKFYPSSDYDAIEGWSFGLQVFSKTTNREYNVDDYSDSILNGKKDSKTKTGIAVVITKQIFQDSNVTFETLFAVGFANVKRERYDQVYNTTTNDQELVALNTSKTSPNLQLGFRIGFGN